MKNTGRFKWLLLAFGAAIFALLLRQYGTRETLRSLAAVWPALPVMVLIEGAAKLANSLGLRCALSPAGRRTPLREIFRLTLEADAVNHLIPTASLGGNALLTRGLMRDGSLSESVVAVTTANCAQNIAQFLLVLAGSALALAATPIPASLRPAVWGVMGVSGVIVCVFFVVQLRGAFVFLSAVLRRVHIRAEYLLERARQVAALDESLRAVLLARPADFALSILCFACGWGVSAAELFVVLRLAGVPFRWQQALAIHALAVFIDSVVFFMPARAGSQEGGKVLAFSAVGLPGAAGLIFGLLRRAREIVWALLGYALLARRSAAAEPALPAAGTLRPRYNYP
jgi:uncharacterized membrane protein YbhN (UPF0104 family)